MRRAVALPAAERARVPEFDEEQEVSYHPQRAFVDVSDAQGGLAVLDAMVVSTPLIGRSMLTLANGAAP